MLQAGFSNRRVAGKTGVHRSLIDRLIQSLQATAMVVERLRSRMFRETTPRQDSLFFSTSARIRDELKFGIMNQKGLSADGSIRLTCLTR